MTVIFKEESQLKIIPPGIRRQAGFKVGDKLEFTVSRGVITAAAKPKGSLFFLLSVPPRKKPSAMEWTN